MSTLMQSRIETLDQDIQNSVSINKALQPWRRHLSIQQTIHLTIRGIVTGLLMACIVLLIGRITPWANAPIWATGIAIACTLFSIGLAIWRRLSFAHTARIVDSRLSLHDRLSTAWELREETATLARLQRRDALKQLQQHKPTNTFSLRPRRFTILLSAIVALAFVLLLILPNPMTAILKQQAAFQARIAKQIAAIDKVRQDLNQQPGITPEEQQKIDQILSDLENKLQQAKTDTQAQQAISQAQAKLNKQRDPQATNKAQGNSAASSALQSSNNPNLKALGNALANNDSKQVADALQKLSSQIDKMSPAQRSQLAQQLENAANQAGQQNPTLSSALHQLAKAVTDNNQSEVADATNSMQTATSQNASSQSKDNNINQIAQSLQQAANNLAASTDNTSNQSQGQQGQGQQSQSQGQGQQSQGQGQGQQSKGQGQGQQGQGQQGQGQQGQGHGGTGGSNGTGTNQGKNEQVTIPGQTSTGSSTQSADNNTGIVQQGSSVPYSQVVEQYNQMAHDAIDNSNVDPNLKDLVHNYFNSLEGQQ